MRPDGWIFLGVSWALILGLCVFCFNRIFARRR
jgi:hypothetical protein